MGSRLKENPDRTFYWFFESSRPIARDKDPGVLFQFPEDFSDEESLQTLPRFCFPYDIEKVKDVVAVQHFTFVLTDLEGCQRFGFCRLASSSHTCLCMLSYLPWFEVFYKLLNNLADYLTKGQTNEMRELLATLYKQPLPLAVSSFTLQLVPYFIAPDPRSLPSIPENRNLTELVVAVDVSNLLHLYASMLFERRILILSSKLSTLTACVHALSAVLYPMYWQHIFIPVLPPHLLDYCCAPMPFLIGVHSSLTEKVKSRGLEDVVILNVDTNTIDSPFDDLKKIPPDVVSGLKLRLKRQAASAGVGVAKAFLSAQALLFGGYGVALRGTTDGQVKFREEIFLEHKSPAMRQFLQSAIHLQLFKQFIDGRLELLNSGREPDDLFEQEILQCGPGAERSKTYQQLVGNLKKGGGALILNVKAKTHMYKSAKRGLRNLLTPKDQVETRSLQRNGSVTVALTQRRSQSECLQSRLPITQHFGKSRPRRPVSRQGYPRDNEDPQDNRDTWEDDWPDSAAPGPIADPESLEEGGDSDLCDPEEMDLLGEIFDTLSSRSSHERGLLYGTRSLDLFGTDTDYIRQRSRATPSQESLGVSNSGSGSLHSWNQEEGLQATGEGPEQTADVGRLDEVQDFSDEAPDVAGWKKEKERREENRSEEDRREEDRREEDRREEDRREEERREEDRREENRREEDRREEKRREEKRREEKRREEERREEERREEERREEERREEERREEKSEEERKEEAEKRLNETEERKTVVMERCDVMREGQQDELVIEEYEESEGSITVEPKMQSEALGEQGGGIVEGFKEGPGIMGNGGGRVSGQKDARLGTEAGTITPKTTDSAGLQKDTTPPVSKHPLGWEGRGDERKDQEEANTPCSPNVLSTVALFQSQALETDHHGKAQTRGSPTNAPRSWDAIQKIGLQETKSQVSLNNRAVPITPRPTVTSPVNDQSETRRNPTEEEDLPLVKVSELKKRFEV